jgi:cytochrome c-type biogenesis protein CcmE
MKPKHQRLRFVLLSMLVMGIGAALLLRTFSDNLIFFYTPTQWLEKSVEPGFDASRELRIGGLVKKGSIEDHAAEMRFIVTDLTSEVEVTYRGMIPSLFREGQGVVAQGHFDNGVFRAKTILAKHDENYMPREVVEQLKASGRWQQ